MSLLGLSHASAASLQIICDNDYALFAGTENSVTRLLYQNNVWWPAQIDEAQIIDLALDSGETHFFLLGLGGGNVEDIGGRMNGHDITYLNFSRSTPITSYLRDYSLNDASNGTYNAFVEDVQAAIDANSGNAFWSPASSMGIVFDGCGSTLTGRSYFIPAAEAVLFRIDGSAVFSNTPDVPEPSTYGLIGVGALGVAIAARRRKAKAA